MTTYGFVLLRDERIPELATRARLYRHEATGAQLLSLENADENKCFGITFVTPPHDSTGVPHIMEHSVLGGSRRFPAKDPFIELSKGSLKTFLNAFTSEDRTMYPVASTNTQDLYNLIDVYMDAVLHPLLTERTFRQEAWHYEPDGPDLSLTIKGVVYNEMRGAYSSPDSLLYRYGRQALFPDTPYALDAGGDPEVIPTLTYQQFLDFHATYYHPSNALIYFYGDDDPEERLRRMAAYLEEHDLRAIDSSVPLQPPFGEPLRLARRYPVSPDEEHDAKALVTVGWLLPDGGDPVLTMSLEILAHILVGTSASPLYKALIDSGLGEDVAGAGIDVDGRQSYFSTGLRGTRAADADRIERLIVDTLTALWRDGIAADTVEASLNTTEFDLRENNTGRFPRGLSLMMRALTTWTYGGDPLSSIAFERPLQTVRQNLRDNPRYFEGLIERYLLANAHRVTLVLEPDPDLAERQQAAERERLRRVRDAMTAEELEAIARAAGELRAWQETPDSPEVLATIPTLTLQDLDPQVPTIPLAESSLVETPVLYHDLFTNGIVYLDLAFDAHVLPQHLLPYLALYAECLTEIGTEDEDYVALSQRIGRQTGGIDETMMISAIEAQAESATWLVLRGKAVLSHTADLLAILQDILLKIRLDNRERFRQILLETKSSMEAGIIPSGHSVAMGRLRAAYDEAGWASEQTGGIDFLFQVRSLAREVDENWPAVLERLEEVRRLLVNRSTMLVNVTVDAAHWGAVNSPLTALLESLPSRSSEHAQWHPEQPVANEALTAPTQVNHVAKGGNLYALGYQYDGSAAVVSQHLRGTWLWDRVRVQGGAYGGFCSFDMRSGVWTFVSYRDPNLLRTLAVFDRTGSYLREVDLSDAELAKTIIGTIGAMDAYLLPDAKGFTSLMRYLVHDTDALRQIRREQVLGTTVADFRALAPVLDRLSEAGIVVVVASPEAARAANDDGHLELTVTRLL